MTKKEFYRFIEQGALEGVCRYFEYWFIYKEVPIHSRVLEIGAGRSMLAKSIIEKDCNVYVTDTNEGAVKWQTYNGVIAEKTDNLDSWGDNMFNVVIAASSIEHFDDDLGMIRQVSRVLYPGGLFIVTIPVGKKYLDNQFKDSPKHPRMRVYDEKTYTDRFLQSFKEVKRKFFLVNDSPMADIKPHNGWGKRVGFKEVNDFGQGVGMCVVLEKIK